MEIVTHPLPDLIQKKLLLVQTAAIVSQTSYQTSAVIANKMWPTIFPFLAFGEELYMEKQRAKRKGSSRPGSLKDQIY